MIQNLYRLISTVYRQPIVHALVIADTYVQQFTFNSFELLLKYIYFLNSSAIFNRTHHNAFWDFLLQQRIHAMLPKQVILEGGINNRLLEQPSRQLHIYDAV